MISKKGISLIVLIITVIVVVILAGAVILNLNNTNVISKAEEAAIRTDLSNLKSELELFHSTQYASDLGSYNYSLLSADYDGVYIDGVLDASYGNNIYDIIASLENSDKYDGNIEIVNGELLYTGESEPLRQIACSMGIIVGAEFSSKGLVDSGISYFETTTSLNNPERGFYKYSRIDVTSPYNSSDYDTAVQKAGWIISDCHSENKSLVLFKISLENCKNTNIPSEWLTGINNIADLYRQAGIKLIVRGDYGNDYDESDPSVFSEPTNFNQITTHIGQLENFFNINKDIIYVVEAGFLGAWGEWYYTDYGDDASRLAVIDKLLEVVPTSRQINLRTPEFYKLKFGDSIFHESLGYSTSSAARVGVHNDAFLSDSTDSGTYDTGERSNELTFLNPLTKYTLFGGEAIMDGSSIYNNTANTISEMTTLHANYLNGSYHPDVMSKWQSLTDNTDSTYSGQTTYKLIQDRLGYRFVLKDSKLPSSVESGENVNISVDIENTGFGNLVNYREAYLLLEKNNQYYKAKIDTEVRRWFAGETTEIDMVFQLPGNIEAGDWNVYIQLPDNNPLLTDEVFFVKFANLNTWNTDVNANYIGNFTVTSGTATNNNNFYQVNAEDLDTTEYGTTSYYTNKIVDGNNTNSEWTSSNIVYNQGGHIMYMDNDAENLYIYVDNGSTPYAYNSIYLDNVSYTEGSKLDGLYKFLLENAYEGDIYTGDGSSWSWNPVLRWDLEEQFDLVKSSGAEYRVPLSFFQVYTPGTVLQNIRFRLGASSGSITLDTDETAFATYTIK